MPETCYTSVFSQTFLATVFIVASAAHAPVTDSSSILPEPAYSRESYKTLQNQQSISLISISQSADSEILTSLVSRIKDTPDEILDTMDELFWEILA